MSRHVFGPVPSRRLGRSLGIDLVPFKTCSYDCLYCQLGQTTCRTVRRKPWAPLDTLLAQLGDKLDAKPDFITLSGSGEPTLFAPLDELIRGIRRLTATPIAVLTNGSLLHRPEVRRELAGADLLVPSLDAGNEAAFQQVNRPEASLRFQQVLEGLIAAREQFRGEYWLEVFLLGGYTTSEKEIADIVDCVERIGPDRVQLNTVTRPPADAAAVAVSREQLDQIAAAFSPRAEVIADFHCHEPTTSGTTTRDDVLELLARRPCSIDDIAAGLGIHRNEAIKCLEHLGAERTVQRIDVGGRAYYRTIGHR